jgi:hypothetical protein
MTKQKKQIKGRRITTTATVVIIVFLLFGGFVYYQTTTSAAQIDNRNLRELSRIGQGIEGRVNNLQSVLKSLAREDVEELEKRAGLIPHFEATTVDSMPEGSQEFKVDIAASLLRIWYDGTKDTISKIIEAEYQFAALYPVLQSDYMETIFISDEGGSVFMWETDRTGIRIHELAALDTLQIIGNNGAGGVGVSDIVNITITGQEYRFYLLPLRINLKPKLQENDNQDAAYTKWILGGMVPASEYRQQSLSIDPAVALWLGFLVIAGCLAVPFVRVFTMGPKERLRAGYLFYLVSTLILGTGFLGFFLADGGHYQQLKNEVKEQLAATADAIVTNINTELRIAMQELDNHTSELDGLIKEVGAAFFNPDIRELDEIRMRETIYNKNFDLSDTLGFYPHFHMVFWTDSTGMQIAKWTPRQQNTPRISVSNRGYFRAIDQNRGWNLSLSKNFNSTTYYIESIRSWTTGENLAAISVPWHYRINDEGDRRGIAAITTKLASLTQPVLPAGVNLAVVDANARTLFHTRPERILDENFAEETNNPNLLHSYLAARAFEDHLELKYGERRKMMILRPLADRPLFLIVFKDKALIDTVRFEAWFEGGALFGIWVILLLFLIFLLNYLASTRMAWIWPDLERPGKYVALVFISVPFIILFIHYSMQHGHLHIHPATLLAPVKFLGLALVVLSWGKRPNPRSVESHLGWVVFLLAVISLLVSSFYFDPFPGTEVFAAAVSLILVVIWLRASRIRNYVNRWAKDVSPRWAYTTAMVSGLLLIGLLPGYLSYLFTYHDHSEHLVKYHQLELEEALTERRIRVEHLLSDSLNSDHWNKPKGHTYDLAYDSLIFGTTLNIGRFTKNKYDTLSNNKDNKNQHHTDSDHHHKTDLHDAMHGLLGNRIPFLTEASIKMRQLSADSIERVWDHSEKDNLIQLQRGKDSPITSRLPEAADRSTSLRALIVIIVLGVLLLIVYYVSRWVFFINLEHSAPLSLKDVLPKLGEKWKNMILVGTGSISRQPLRELEQNGEVHFIDMISLKAGYESDDPPRTAKVIFIDHADHRIEEPDWNKALLGFLEKKLFTEGSLPVIMITGRDLSEIIPSLDADGDQGNEMKRRWNRVLSRFTKVLLSDNVPSGSFEVTMRLRLIQKISRDLEELAGIIARDSAEQTIESYKNLEEEETANTAPVKMEWLKQELTVLDRLLNPGKYHSSVKPPDYSADKLDKEITAIEELLGSITEVREKRADKKRTIHTFADILGDLSSDAEYCKEKAREIADMATGKISKNKKLKDSDTSVIEWFKLKLKRLYYSTAIWIGPTKKLKAERKMFREKKNTGKVFRALLRECGRHERLQEIGLQIMSRPGWPELKETEIIDLVKESAETYYANRWAILTQPERLVAAQLAKGAVVNPNSQQAVTRLYARGFITRKPELGLENESFARYIVESVPPERLLEWEREDIPSTWGLIRGPIFIALILTAIFLFWANQELLSNTVAFLGTIGVGLAAILNLLSKLNRGTGGGAIKVAE